MFSKKSLPINIALILVIALSTLGLAYGAWSDTLNINGTVTTGTLDVQLQMAGFDNVGCTAVLSDNKDTLTLTATNAVPGMVCWSQLEVLNNSTIPIKIESVNTVESGAGYWEMDCNFAGMILQPNGDFGGECLVWAQIPDDNSSQGQTSGIVITVNAVQKP